MNMQVHKCANIQVRKHVNWKVYKYASVKVWKYANIQEYKNVRLKVYKFPSLQICSQLCKYIDLQVLKYQLCKYEIYIYKALFVSVCHTFVCPLGDKYFLHIGEGGQTFFTLGGDKQFYIEGGDKHFYIEGGTNILCWRQRCLWWCWWRDGCEQSEQSCEQSEQALRRS